MSLEVVAAVIAAIAGVVLFIRGVMLVRQHRRLPGQLMMWGGVAILMVGGFATMADIGFIMVIASFALIGQGLAETVRARRANNRRRPYR